MSDQEAEVREGLLEHARSETLPPLREVDRSISHIVGQSGLRKATTFAPGPSRMSGESEELGTRGAEAIEAAKKYKMRYSRPFMRQAKFMNNFRTFANRYNVEVSPQGTPRRTTSQVMVPLEDDARQSSPSVIGALSHGHDPMRSKLSSALSMDLGPVHPGPSVLHAAHIGSCSRERKAAQARTMSFHLSRARLAFEIAFTSAAVIAACVVAYIDSTRDSRAYSSLYGVPLLSWMVLAALIMPTIRLADWLVEALVKAVEVAASVAKLENVHYTLIGLSDALRLVASALLMMALVMFIMKERRYDLPDDNLKKIKIVSLCLVIFALVELFKTLGCRLLSLRVNAESLFDMLKTTIEKEKVLNTIMSKKRPGAVTAAARDASSDDDGAEMLAAIAELRSLPEWSVPHYLNDLYVMSLPVDNSAVQSFTDRITELVAQFRTMSEAQLDEHATCAAEYCWLTMRQDLSKEKLFRDDFMDVLKNDEETDFAFSLFDLDGDGYITEPEVHSRFQVMYRERRNLARTLQDNDDVITTLELLTGIVLHTIAIGLYFWLFGTDIMHMLISLSSIFVASAFVFGNSLKTYYESVVFLFVIRPYQVGDAIIYKDALHIVKNFGLLTTQLMRYDGCRIWVPNQTLMSTDIINVTQSRALQDRLSFEVDAGEISPEQCEALANRLLDMMQREEPRRLFDTDFVPLAYLQGLANPLKYNVGVAYMLAFNGEKFARVVEARTLVTNEIGAWLKEEGIKHSTSVQPLMTYEGGGGGFKKHSAAGSGSIGGSGASHVKFALAG